MPGLFSDAMLPTTIGGIGSIGSDLINGLMQHFTNVSNRKFTREMYARQRTDALADWNMQNAYNSPQAQMERFKAAGLNPHLVYGQQNMAQPVRSSSGQSGNAQAVRAQFNAGDTVRSFYDIALAKENIKNAQKSRDAMDVKMLKDAADTELKRVSTSRGQLDYKGALADYDSTRELLRQKVKLTAMGVDVAQQGMLRQNALAGMSIAKGFTEMALNKAKTQLTEGQYSKISGELKLLEDTHQLRQLEIMLKKKGFSWSDPYWIRMASSAIDQILPAVKESAGKVLPSTIGKLMQAFFNFHVF